MILHKGYKKLFLAILFEIFSTTMLVLSNGFTRILPSVLAVIGYAICFYIMTYVFRIIKMGVAYAIWSGMGIVAINVIGIFAFHTPVTGGRFIGIWFIVAGIIITHLNESNSVVNKL